MENFKSYCSACDSRAACEYTFGDYWESKSRNGIGCNVPIPASVAIRIEQCAKIVRPEAYARKPISIRADVLARLKRMSAAAR